MAGSYSQRLVMCYTKWQLNFLGDTNRTVASPERALSNFTRRGRP